MELESDEFLLVGYYGFKGMNSYWCKDVDVQVIMILIFKYEKNHICEGVYFPGGVFSYTIYLNMRKVRFSYLNMRKLYTYRKLMPQNPLNTKPFK